MYIYISEMSKIYIRELFLLNVKIDMYTFYLYINLNY